MIHSTKPPQQQLKNTSINNRSLPAYLDQSSNETVVPRVLVKTGGEAFHYSVPGKTKDKMSRQVIKYNK